MKKIIFVISALSVLALTSGVEARAIARDVYIPALSQKRNRPSRPTYESPRRPERIYETSYNPSETYESEMIDPTLEDKAPVYEKRVYNNYNARSGRGRRHGQNSGNAGMGQGMKCGFLMHDFNGTGNIELQEAMNFADKCPKARPFRQSLPDQEIEAIYIGITKGGPGLTQEEFRFFRRALLDRMAELDSAMIPRRELDYENMDSAPVYE